MLIRKIIAEDILRNNNMNLRRSNHPRKCLQHHVLLLDGPSSDGNTPFFKPSFIGKCMMTDRSDGSSLYGSCGGFLSKIVVFCFDVARFDEFAAMTPV